MARRYYTGIKLLIALAISVLHLPSVYAAETAARPSAALSEKFVDINRIPEKYWSLLGHWVAAPQEYLGTVTYSIYPDRFILIPDSSKKAGKKVTHVGTEIVKFKALSENRVALMYPNQMGIVFDLTDTPGTIYYSGMYFRDSFISNLKPVRVTKTGDIDPAVERLPFTQEMRLVTPLEAGMKYAKSYNNMEGFKEMILKGSTTTLTEATRMAVCPGDEAFFTFLLKEYGARINDIPEGMSHPIFDAICAGKKNFVDALLANGARLDLKDYRGKTIIERAAECGKHEMMTYLIEVSKKQLSPPASKTPINTKVD